MDTVETSVWLWLAYGCELRLSRLKHILSPERLRPVGRLADLMNQPVATWQSALGLTPAEAQALQRHSNRRAEATQLAQQLAAGGVGVWSWLDPAYPASLSASLDELHRPLLLFYKGDPAAVTTPPIVAILGAEAPDEETLTLAQDLAGLLAIEGVILVHGGGPGVEETARSSAAEVGGAQIVVCDRGLLSDPLPTVRPGELFLSPFHPTTQEPVGAAARYTLVTALAQVVLVVGSTLPEPRREWVEASLQQGKPVWFYPGVGVDSWVAAGARPLANEEVLLAAVLGLECSIEQPYGKQPDWPAERVPAGPAGVERGTMAAAAEAEPLEPEALVKLLAGSGKVPEVLKARLKSDSTGR